MTSTREEQPRRHRLVAAFVNIGLGLVFLYIAFSRPAIANLRLHDIVPLLATGACLGMGLMLLVRSFVDRRQG
jgi:hypothetical protein